MTEKICCFCGHRFIVNGCLEDILENTLIDLIDKQGYNTFYSGGWGSLMNFVKK